MTSVKTKAWAKLNLVLHIVGKRPDGRHNIETVMHAIDLADDVEVTLEPGSGAYTCASPQTTRIWLHPCLPTTATLRTRRWERSSLR